MQKRTFLGAGLLCIFPACLFLVLAAAGRFANCQTAEVRGTKDEVREKEQPESYEELKMRVASVQDSLSSCYKKASVLQKDSLLGVARQFLFAEITQNFFPHWFGTPWDFNGCTKTPGEGKIACGQFVNAVLQDVGFDIPRNRWAQLASEPVIKILSSDLKRFSNKPIANVQSYIKGRPDGLYVVGLDMHVGYIYKRGNTIKFVHSSYYEPEKGVMAEELDSENPLRDSKYRVVGRILEDDMMKKWLTKEAYTVN